jgi:NAD(P)-dependent dehydrogenase (short-subunit alcohol dehydrogenase family)
MNVEGSVALVTGANRGLGAAFARGLLAAGAQTVYGGARSSYVPDPPGVIPVELDITNPDHVAAAAARLGEVNLLINNAGVLHPSNALADDAVSALQADFETNVFGTLAMSRAFAPILASNGGGAIVNVLSVLSWFSLPGVAPYAASKAACWSLTNGLRLELRPKNVLVTAVHAGFIDTDMTATINAPKTAPEEVVSQVLEALAAGQEEVLIDDISRQVKTNLAADITVLYPAAPTG